MPRKKMDVLCDVDHLAVLDDTGKLDEGLEPEIPEETLLKLHKFMLTGRRFDERLLKLQRQGRMGTFAPIAGQEASHVGAVALLRDSDWFVPSFRETAAELWRGRSMESVILVFAGYNEGARVDVKEGEKGPNNMPVAVPVGTQVLHAAGIGWAMKYRETDDVVMTFFGDGATSEGDFHEGMNMAAVFQCPVVFVCQNNHWAISVPRSRQSRSKTLAQKAVAYGMPGIQVDGNDVLAVYTAAKEAVERARSGDGPTMIECVTYRMQVHTTADDPKRYRKEEEVEEWRKRDPISRFQKYLKEKNLLDGGKIEKLEEEIEEKIKKAVENAEQKMKEFTDPLHMFEHVYAELPPYTAQQRDELKDELREAREE